jgi:hypothetical protein
VPPKQFTDEALALKDGAGVLLIVILVLATHPLASIAETEYMPEVKPVSGDVAVLPLTV